MVKISPLSSIKRENKLLFSLRGHSVHDQIMPQNNAKYKQTFKFFSPYSENSYRDYIPERSAAGCDMILCYFSPLVFCDGNILLLPFPNNGSLRNLLGKIGARYLLKCEPVLYVIWMTTEETTNAIPIGNRRIFPRAGSDRRERRSRLARK